ncbi:MAG: hypothetical protein M3Y08_20675 [Fibrobacterota bacterium]|nr:hypothetical protein [Fibrobacterota bacterium]
MEDMEKLLTGYQDLYSAPTSERVIELKFKLSDMDWDGLYLGAPKTAPAATKGIPILVLEGYSSLREWEVEPPKNSSIVVADLERGTARTWPLYKPPVKRKTPQPKDAKPDADSQGRRYGTEHHIVGESLPDDLQSGEYAIAIVSWDLHSNRKVVRKEGVAKPVDPGSATLAWPWERWADPRAFAAAPDSPKLKPVEALTLKVEGKGAERKLRGAFSLKARPVHLIPAGAKGRTDPSIHAGVNVDFFLYELDDPIPAQERIVVPIHATAPVRAGDLINGWFTIPFPYEPIAVDAMLYAMVDGNLTGPFRVSGP